MLELSHKKLEVWKLSMEVTKEIYKLTAAFPKEELFNLTSQMRRASASVVSNLSEGASRISKAEKRRFFEISRSSLVEPDTQIEICLMLGYLNQSNIILLTSSTQSVFKILSKLISNSEGKQ